MNHGKSEDYYKLQQEYYFIKLAGKNNRDLYLTTLSLPCVHCINVHNVVRSHGARVDNTAIWFETLHCFILFTNICVLCEKYTGVIHFSVFSGFYFIYVCFSFLFCIYLFMLCCSLVRTGGLQHAHKSSFVSMPPEVLQILLQYSL